MIIYGKAKLRKVDPMKVLLDRDTSNRNPGVTGFMGIRIIPGRANYPYPFIKLEVDAVVGRTDHTFNVSVWHPSTGWNHLLDFQIKDFPLDFDEVEIEEIYAHMVSEVDQIFSGEPWETVQKKEPELPTPRVQYREL